MATSPFFAGRALNTRSRPSPTVPGMKYFPQGKSSLLICLILKAQMAVATPASFLQIVQLLLLQVIAKTMEIVPTLCS